ncbi:hypothetical protein GOBAR_AA00766 [Gossypium barbadense]|uniref:Myb/SANT-like domain-containing protein n=1 Tax=Gossypium barbadense TaxID=3634 RepID=A0A2P5YW86_GOSBA|nr:hypothetical protein GOBAR_AA00766 [Gossypium barbadense]
MCFFCKIAMFDFLQSSVPKEDAALVAYMLDLYTVGTYNAYTGFKAGYFNELEQMLDKNLPHAMLKAKPNLESMIWTLKRDWTIIYDMLSGKDNSGFGWDEHRQMVVAEDAMQNSYITAGQFRHHSFPYYDQLTSICAKDQAIRKDAQVTVDIVEEIDDNDVATANNLEEGNNYHGCEDKVSLNEMDVSTIQLQPSKPNQDEISTSITDAAIFLGENIWTVGLELSRSIATEKVI